MAFTLSAGKARRAFLLSSPMLPSSWMTYQVSLYAESILTVWFEASSRRCSDISGKLGLLLPVAITAAKRAPA